MERMGIEFIPSKHPDLDATKAWVAKLIEEGMGRQDCPGVLRGMEVDFNWGEEMAPDRCRGFFLKLFDGRIITVSFM